METLLKKLKENNISISLDNADLKVKFNGKSLPKEIIAEMKEKKQLIIEYLSNLNQVKETEINPAPLSSDGAYPVTSAQRRLWVLSQFEEGSIAYNMRGGYILTGSLNKEALSYAFKSLVLKYEILRTVFHEDENGDIKQFILSPEEMAAGINYYDLRGNEEQDTLLKTMVQKELNTSFDLSNGPLIYAGLYQLTDERWVFTYMMHHMISDGWSMGILIHELMSVYNRAIKGDHEQSASLRIQYKDYAVWLQEQLSDQSLQSHKDYWLQQLEGEIPVLELSGDRVRPAMRTYNGGIVYHVLKNETTDRLRDLLKQEGSTLFMGLLATLNALLYRYTGQVDMVIGSPVAGRDHADLENQIGFYLNTLALRSRFGENDSFTSLLHKVKQITLGAYEHQIYPFDELVDQLDLKWNMSRNALFDVMIILQNTNVLQQGKQQKFGDVEISTFEGGGHVLSKTDLTFDFREIKEGLQLSIEYNSDIYNRETAVSLANYFEQLLEKMLDQPAAPISSIDYLAIAEQEKLLKGYNETAADYPAEKTITDLFEAQVVNEPDKVALIFEDTAYTYAELNEKSNQLADYLRIVYQIEPDDRIAIMLPRNEWMVIAILAVLKAGGAYVPVDMEYPEERIGYIMDNSQCKVLINAAELELFFEKADSYSISDSLLRSSSSNLAYVIYTSGSTGKPKGVMIEHRNVISFFENLKGAFGFTPDMILAAGTSFTFDISVLELLGTLVNGVGIQLMESIDSFDFLTDNDTQVNALQITPSKLNQLLEFDPSGIEKLKKLNVLLIGGEAWSERDYSRLKTLQTVRVTNVYGPTETTIWSTSLNIQESKVLSIGRPLLNEKIYIIDQQQKPVPIGVPGEICIGGAGVARGYMNREDLTAERFVQDPFVQGERMYKTGDLGKRLADGTIEFLGRFDDQVKIRGYRIELEEVKKAVQQYPGIESVAIIDRSNAAGEKELVAYLVCKEAPSVAEMRTALLKILPAYMIPGYFVQLDQLPLTLNGKLDRKKLPDPAQAGIATGAAYVAPENETEERLVKIWQAVLEKEKIGIRDNFFESGGNSLKASRLASLLYKEFEVKLTLGELFVNTVLQDQAGLILQKPKTSFVALEPVAPQKDYALSSSQRRLWILSQFDEGNMAYNMPDVYVFTGSVDLAAMEYAFDALIYRHEILRTVFKEDEAGEVRQVVLPAEVSGFNIDFTDLRYEASPLTAAESRIQSELKIPFDLAEGPLIRAGLYQVSEDKWIFNYTIHHIISDGWSMVILINEFLNNYHARVHQGNYSPEPLRIQYKDYAAWQQLQLSGESLKKHKDYWLKQFEGDLPVIELPADHIRPAVKTYHGGMIKKQINAGTVKGFRQLLNERESTLFMGLMAVTNALFYRYTGQQDIIIGSPAAGREHIDLEDQIGFYLNLLPLRTRFSGAGDFIQLLDEIKRVTLGAYEHQIYPFDELIDKLDLQHDPSRNSLFDVMVVLHAFTHGVQSAADSASDFTVSAYESQQQVMSKYDLTLNFSEYGDALELNIEYNADIFDPETVSRLGDHFIALLEEATGKSLVPLSQLIYLNEQEQLQLLEVFNDTVIDYAEEDTIIDLFKKQVASTPDQTAVLFEGKAFTYRYLDELSDQLGDYLSDIYHTQPDDLIGIQLARSEWLIIAILGVMKSTAAYIPIDPEYPAERVEYILTDSQCKVLLDESVLSAFRETLGTYQVTAGRKIILADSLAYCIYTSGTTGNPKGCLLSHKNVVNFFTGMTDVFGREPGTMLSLTNYTFDISVLELVWTLTLGYKVIVQKDVRDLISSIDSENNALDFSLFYFGNAEHTNEGDQYKLLLDGAKFADENDFSAVWTPERHFHEFGGLYPNPSVLGAALSTITKNVNIRAGSVVLPLHNPIRVAEEWAVVDNLSGGRTGIAFASGWNANDFVLSPESYHNRHEIMYEAIGKVQQLWRGESLPIKDGNAILKQIRIFPKPVSKELPIWITSANSIDTFISAGKLGFNILTHLLGETVEGLAVKIAAYREAYQAGGHDVNQAKVALMLHTYIGEDLESTYAVAKKPFISYLRTSAGLIKNLAVDLGLDMDAEDFTPEDMDALLEYSFNRYATSASLIGTKATCSNMLGKLSRAGVTEIACLVDFGVEYHAAMKGLEYVAELKTEYKATLAAQEAEGSAFEALLKNQITHLQATPSMAALLQPHLGRLNSLKTILLGGERLPVSLTRKLYAALPEVEIYNMYGPTETTIWSACWKVEQSAEKIHIGKPIANTKIYILDQYNNLVPVGASGELYIGGKGVGQGYINNPGLSDEKFIENFFCPGERLYRTGDFARWLPDGNIEYIGRKDDQVKVNGHRIELGEIESALLQNELVTGVSVLIRESSEGEKELVAYVVGEDKLKVVDLRAGLSTKLPAYMIPVNYIQIEYLPLNTNGKVDKKKLPDVEGYSIDATAAYVGPRNETEEKLVLIWQEVLNRNKIGVLDNFFELGGHSLKAIGVLSRVREDLKVKLRVDELFSNLTIELLAMEIARKKWATSEKERGIVTNDKVVVI